MYLFYGSIIYLYEIFLNSKNINLIELFALLITFILLFSALRFLKIVSINCLITLKLGDKIYLELDDNYIKFKQLNGKFKVIKKDELQKLDYFDWGISGICFRTMFIKANNLKIYLPIEGLNSSKFEILEQFKKIFPDKFF